LDRKGNSITLRHTLGASPEESPRDDQIHPRELALQPLHLTVPNDMSSAAFPLAAAAIVPDSRVTILGAGSNETRTGFLDLLAGMGAWLDVENSTLSGGEPIADIALQQAPLHGIEVSGHLVVRAIDELPVWAVVGSQARGLSELNDAAELRLKEVDRISILAGELSKMGANVNERSVGLAIIGPTRLSAAEVDSHGDHRLGMALAIAGLVADGPTSVQNAGCIADSFPGFVETMQSLGATMQWVA
jgi:3-phosphoshikimate 1-carboxyvinyltransferase